jgi:MFS family permease
MFRRGNTPGKEEVPLKEITDNSTNSDFELEIVPLASSNDLIGLVRLHWNVVCIAAIVCLGAMQVGFHIGYSSPAGKAVQSAANITSQQLDLALSTMNIGCIVGSLISSVVANRFGRKKGIILANVPFLIGIGILMSPLISYERLVASRFCKLNTGFYD